MNIKNNGEKKFKICMKCKCKKVADLINFKSHKETKDGLSSWCRKCKQKTDRIYSRKYRLEHPEWKKMDNKRNLPLQKKLIKEYQKKFPERVSANAKAGRAKRSGKLKQECCIVCGSEKSVMHHSDYTKPCEVVWLCHLHHKQLHAGIIVLEKIQQQV